MVANRRMLTDQWKGIHRMVGLILFFSILSPLKAQELPILEKKISITSENESLENLLKRLSQKVGCVFSYSSSVIDVKRTYSGTFNDQPLRAILEEVFAGGVEAKQKGVYVILSPRQISKKELVVSGYVVDENTGKAIRDATVYDPITLKSSITDEFGYFQLAIKNPNLDSVRLVVNKKDYGDTLLVNDQLNPFQKVLLKTSEVDLEGVGKSLAKPMKDAWQWTKKSMGSTNLENVSDTLYRKVQVSLVPFIGTNRKLSGNVINDYSFNVWGGFSAGTNKVELGGLFNTNKGDVKFLQMAGLFNLVGGAMQGVQMAGLTNVVLDDTRAVQMGGLGNFTSGSLQGVQLGGVLNLATKEVKGAQLGGVANYAHSDLSGVQVAGILNIGNRIKGSQIGLFNYADSISGVSIGLLSIVRKGYRQVEVGADEVLPLNFAFRTGTRNFYNILSAGFRPDFTDSVTWAFGYGVGAAPRLGKKVFMNIELSSSQMNLANVAALNLINRAYIGLEYQFSKNIGIYFGPSLNWRLYDTGFQHHPDMFTYANPRIQNENSPGEGSFASQMWFGGRAGLRIY
ncbi:carboxypeptidase-like regulatory domain-containing protein [Arthrospiribacter ruber]|uniref:carboxypeptidase-like regulatory domain-containing protein n=1 Tax=Arthrospiribacter ruber TaxID=2487934 RepID=UPI001FE2AEAA|nr:carboxypeptidase-like regulatory domain-containing protein [Arthrospiribacter ruber]